MTTICNVDQGSLIDSETATPETHCWRESGERLPGEEEFLSCDEVPTHQVTMSFGYTFSVCELHAETAERLQVETRARIVKIEAL